MLMARSSDLMTLGYSPSAKLQFIHVEVTDAARALEQSHLCGPTASLVLAESLAGVALLGSELTEPEETLTLRLRVTGPVQGVLVEVCQGGGLRGYTDRKVIGDLDDREEMDTSEAFGDHADAQLIRSVPGRILAHANVETRPASVRATVEQYCRQSLQRRAAVQIAAVAYGGSLDVARGLLVWALPDTPPGAFERLSARFADDTAAEELEASDSLAECAKALGIDDLQCEPSRPLRFACRCSRERVASMLAGLSVSELGEMAGQSGSATVCCHMCGKGYEIRPDEIQTILKSRRTEG